MDKTAEFSQNDYPPQLDFSTPPLAITHLQPISQASIMSGSAMIGVSGSHRSGGVCVVPPPDVTQLTNTNIVSTNNIQILHEVHPVNVSNNSCSTQTTSITGNGSMMSTIPSSTKKPQGILKAPNRAKPQQQLLSASLVGVGVPSASGGLHILNIPTSAGISGNLLMTACGTYDPENVSTFNAATSTALIFNDSDGHLV